MLEVLVVPDEFRNDLQRGGRIHIVIHLSVDNQEFTLQPPGVVHVGILAIPGAEGIAHPLLVPPNLVHPVVVAAAQGDAHLVELGMEQQGGEGILPTGGIAVDAHLREVHVPVLLRCSLHPQDAVRETGILEVPPAHILEGLIIACDNIDEVVHIIRASKTPVDAQRNLEQRFDLDELQSKAIVDMRLSQLTGLRMDQLHAEFDDLMKQIEYLQNILDDPELCKKVMKDELQEVKEKYGDPRRTQIVPDEHEFNAEDFYPNDPVVITVSHLGYIKRTPLNEFREQARGGVGMKGARTRDNDFTEYIYPATMHQTMLFFTKKGRCYWLKCYELPEGDRNSKGRAIQNMLNIDADDAVNNILRLRGKGLEDEEFINSHYVVFATKNGTIKKTLLEAYSRPRANGVIAINILEGDEVVDVRLTNGNNELIMADRNGRAVRFNENTVRAMGRVSTGVRGMKIDDDDDAVVGMIVVNKPEEETVMVVSENGYGKRTAVVDENGEDIYRVTNRGGKGVKTLNITEKTGRLVAIKNVTDENDLMIINKSGIAIRLAVKECRVMGRATQGVRLINLAKKNDVIASVCKVMGSELEAYVEQKSREEYLGNQETQPEEPQTEEPQNTEE